MSRKRKVYTSKKENITARLLMDRLLRLAIKSMKREKKAVKAKSRGVAGERWKERGCTLKRTSVSRGLQVVVPGRKRREKGTRRKCGG